MADRTRKKVDVEVIQADDLLEDENLEDDEELEISEEEEQALVMDVFRELAHRMRPDLHLPPGATYEGAGRNDPCPCGSGRKFKRCHGKEG